MSYYSLQLDYFPARCCSAPSLTSRGEAHIGQALLGCFPHPQTFTSNCQLSPYLVLPTPAPTVALLSSYIPIILLSLLLLEGKLHEIGISLFSLLVLQFWATCE